MAILNNPFRIEFSRQGTVPGTTQKDMMFELTNLGRKEVDQLEGDEAEFPIMAALHHKAMSMEEIDKETHLGIAKIKFELRRLVKQLKVKTVGANG